MKHQYIIVCEFYKRIPRVSLGGPTTILVTNDGFAEKPTLVVYLKDHSDINVPRLNQSRSEAEVFTNKKEANKLASMLSKTSFDEGKLVCKVEQLK